MARMALKVLVKQEHISTHQAAHWAMNLGDEEFSNYLYSKLASSSEEYKGLLKGLSFRKERRLKNVNCYQEILRLEEKESKGIIEKATMTSIELSGGIGDHIEEMSRIIPWMEKEKKQIHFFSTNNRIKQLKGLTDKCTWVESRKSNISSKVFMAALGNDLPAPKEFIDLSEDSNIKDDKCLICLTATGDSDNLSRWARSFGFAEAFELMKNLIHQGNKVTDISEWKEWEDRKIVGLGIKKYEPKKYDVIRLAREVCKNHRIITIDTALAHLCAAMGKECTVLLPKYFDERWHDLMKNGSSYKEKCHIKIQKNYGTWLTEIEEIVNT